MSGAHDKLDLKNLVSAMIREQSERWPVMATAFPTTATPALTATRPTLNYADRCDACGAKAYFKAEFAWWADNEHMTVTTGELLFCGHHATMYENRLQETAFSITDERWNISA